MEIVRGHADRPPSEQRTATFTGTVFADPLRSGPDVTMASVFFAPGSRTFWHSHEKGQILVVTAGAGLVCSIGGVPQVLHPGDAVWVPPGEAHWHGGGPETYLVHLAISLGRTDWREAVADDAYRARS
ncbi:cupin domain-containing protein [Phytohabitans suffuscus]|uniref:Cupin n=1 Tax=Phytohabitans suffuscus TaxID=624315 RepID=A0A6F8YU17_9ACTN|nr:cupin domain-containing protein [Phytohabitans suffuscus]BCB89428.1 cupin [Phytohabitans suffuscus]